MNTRKVYLFFIFMFLAFTGCYKNEPIPTAEFVYAGDNGFKVPCTVMFTNQSVNSFSWKWRFGDDSVSTLKEPSHTYTRPGKYDVYLRAYTESCKEWASVIKTITIKDTVQ